MWLKEIKNRLDQFRPRELPKGKLTRAAVFLPLSVESGILTLTMLERTMEVNHPGQISFPGGHMEPSDKSFIDTALREMNEEIGVRQDQVIPLGRLSDRITPTGYWIRPFVGAIPAKTAFHKNREEIKNILTIPLLELTVQSENPAVFRFGSYIVWGVSARILEEFLSVVISGNFEPL